MSPIRPVRSSGSGGCRISPRLHSCGACAFPGDGVYGFPRSLAHTIEPRAPIGKLGFTEGYPPLDVGENVQKGISMHAAKYTATPISRALRRQSNAPRGRRPKKNLRALGDLGDAHSMRVKTRDAGDRPHVKKENPAGEKRG